MWKVGYSFSLGREGTLMFTDEELYKATPHRTLHERWASETSEDGEIKRCTCEGCQEKRRKWWGRVEIISHTPKRSKRVKK